MKTCFFLVTITLRINIMRIHKMLICCVKLDHALYSINYSIPFHFMYENKISSMLTTPFILT